MKPFDYSTAEMVIDETGSLQKFYALTNELSRTRYVRFTGKMDEADNIEWNFKYHGSPLTLQYNVYNGLTLLLQDSKALKIANQLIVKLRAKAV